MQMPGLRVNPVMLLQLYNKVVGIGGKKDWLVVFSLVRPEPMTFQAPKNSGKYQTRKCQCVIDVPECITEWADRGCNVI